MSSANSTGNIKYDATKAVGLPKNISPAQQEEIPPNAKGSLPALQEAFKSNPSKITAVALLKLGDPYPYFDNFAKDDLELLAEPDGMLVYTNNFWVIEFGLGKKFDTQTVPTIASELKPKARENLSLLLDALAGNQDGKAIPFLLILLKDPNNPLSEEKIANIFEQTVSPKEIPLLLAELKGNTNKQCASIIFDYLKEQMLQDQLSPGIKDEIVQTLLGLINNEKNGTKAVMALAESGEKTIIPYLQATIKNNFYCSSAVRALTLLGNFETEFKMVLEDSRYSNDAKFWAALALAKTGKRDGVPLLINRLYDEIIGFRPADFETIKDLLETVSKIIQPEDISSLKIFLDSSFPQAVLLGLDFLKELKDPKNIPLVLPLLNFAPASFVSNVKFKGVMAALNTDGVTLKMIDKNMAGASDNIQLEVKFEALIILATLRQADDRETLDIIEEEVEFWETFYVGKNAFLVANASILQQEYNLYKAVKSILPALEEYIEDSELILAEAAKPQGGLQLKLDFDPNF